MSAIALQIYELISSSLTLARLKHQSFLSFVFPTESILHIKKNNEMLLLLKNVSPTRFQ